MTKDDLDKFVERYNQAPRIHYRMRNFNSSNNSLTLADEVEPHSFENIENVSIKELFSSLGIPEEKFKEVYEHDGTGSFSRFKKDGKQKLADLIGKEIVYHIQISGYDPRTLPDPEICTPKKEKKLRGFK